MKQCVSDAMSVEVGSDRLKRRVLLHTICKDANKAQIQSWLLKEEGRLGREKKKIEWSVATELGDATRATTE